ncbi:hypothetical protein D5086_031406 [Populus alba]|uniref:Uncharacterized protein n=1 Tax=Populus alba TaxID=43335 RepID=A0ACC4AIK4_POPAL
MLKRKTKQRAVLASVDIIRIRNRSLSTPRTCTSNLRFARVKGREVAPDKRNAVDGVMWFRSSGDVGGEASVGLSLEIVGGMKWEQERAGWLGGGGSDVTVKRVEELVAGRNLDVMCWLRGLC